MSNFLAPPDLAKALVGAGEKKALLDPVKMIVLGILAGVYIGFAAHLATTVGTGVTEFGIKKFLVGSVFSVGLMLVIIPGSELWTGNNLMTIALMERKITLASMMKNWTFVYLGNLIGSVILAWIIASASGLLDSEVGVTAVKIAVDKVSGTGGHYGHNFSYFFRAIGCNWLVCLAVMIAIASQDIGGKVLGIYFPIMAFVTSGFEHCIANMYFIPAGIFAKGLPGMPEKLATAGVTGEALDALNWGTMWTQNIVSVTIGNFVGGAVLVGIVYWFLFVRTERV